MYTLSSSTPKPFTGLQGSKNPKAPHPLPEAGSDVQPDSPVLAVKLSVGILQGYYGVAYYRLTIGLL